MSLYTIHQILSSLLYPLRVVALSWLRKLTYDTSNWDPSIKRPRKFTVNIGTTHQKFSGQNVCYICSWLKIFRLEVKILGLCIVWVLTLSLSIAVNEWCWHSCSVQSSMKLENIKGWCKGEQSNCFVVSWDGRHLAELCKRKREDMTLSLITQTNAHLACW